MATPANANFPQFDQLVHSRPLPNFALMDGATLLTSWMQEVSMNLWEPITSSGEVLPPVGRSLIGNAITRLHVTAPDVDIAAKVFINCVKAEFSGKRVILPPLVDVDQGFNLNNIFHSRRVWNM